MTQFTSVEEHRQALGTARIEPQTSVVAGSVTNWTLTLTVGQYGIDEGGTIKIARRFASDMEDPQFSDSSASGYTTVETTGGAKLIPSFQRKSGIRPWMKCLVIDVIDGSLDPGDEVIVRFGDRRQGSPGMRAQTFLESRHEFRIFVDPTNACLGRPIAESPWVRIVAGKPEKIIAVASSQIWPGQTGRLTVRSEDIWRNPVAIEKAEVCKWIGSGSIDLKEDGIFSLREPGVGRFSIRVGNRECLSNPIRLCEKEPEYKFYWADFHAQSDSTVGTGSEEEYFQFARKWACLDATSHQANDFQLTDAAYARLNETIHRHHCDGEFVILPGYEWSGNTPSGGDRNVFYGEEDQPLFRSSNWQIEGKTKFETAHPASELFEKLKANGNSIVCSHVGGRYADIRKYYDEEICSLVEVVSCWGIFEWMIWDAIDKGYIFGVFANSDGHKGRPGAEGPGAGDFGIAGGLTCIQSPELTRKAVFMALKSRRCYGTTGARILLDFGIGGARMGEVTLPSSQALHIAAHACSPIEKIEVFHGKDIVHTFRPPEFRDCSASSLIRITWKGARHRGRGRRVHWNGNIRVEGNEIMDFKLIAFDSAADFIRRSDARSLEVRSSTTGDEDGVELILENGKTGQLIFETPQGIFSESISNLVIKTFFAPGLDVAVTFERYPTNVETRDADYRLELSPITGPVFCRLKQTDGHFAWSSPIHIKAASPDGKP